MRSEVQAAVAQLRREIDILSASILARSRLPAPEVLTSQRVSIGADRAAVRISAPAEAARSLEPSSMGARIDQRDRIAPAPAPHTGEKRAGILERLLKFVRRALRAFTG